MGLPNLDTTSIDDLGWTGLQPPENCESLEIINTSAVGLRYRTPPSTNEDSLGSGGGKIFGSSQTAGKTHAKFQTGRVIVEIRVEVGGGAQTIRRIWS